MDFIDRFIPSKDTRKYLHSIHHKFSDLEKATIVANHIMLSYEDKIAWLTEFKDTVKDKQLQDRIEKAVRFIKKDKKSYKKGWHIDHNDFLYDFVFIPHDFRHGDIVRCVHERHEKWDTTKFQEKVGIIIGFFEDTYDFYKNLKGDYSDVQICVDIKFDGVSYQGEFHHDHINPIYIERLRLHEKDERRVYLDYLTNIYLKKNKMLGEKSEPEYVGDLEDKLEMRYLDEHIPVYDAESRLWCVQTGHGFESGSVDYVAGEFCGAGLIYHFTENGTEDHTHGFDGVLECVLNNPENVEILTEYGEYSEQEIRMIESVKRTAAFVKDHNRPMTNAELRANRKGEAENEPQL